jgi:hypothetical protein
MTVPTRFNYMNEAPRPSILDVLTAGVSVKHDVNVTLDKQARVTLLGAVGILAGAAFLAVMLARRK